MRTNVLRVLLAGAVIAVGAVGPARASSTEAPRSGFVGTGTVILPCRQYPDYGILAPVYNKVHPACPDGTKPVVLTVAAPDRGDGYVSLCDPGRTSCVQGLRGSLWTNRPIPLYCSVVVGRTWYGLMGASSDGHPAMWWAFKVVDGGDLGGDRFGVELTHRTDRGPCGAAEVRTMPVVAGDFRLVAAPEGQLSTMRREASAASSIREDTPSLR